MDIVIPPGEMKVYRVRLKGTSPVCGCSRRYKDPNEKVLSYTVKEGFSATIPGVKVSPGDDLWKLRESYKVRVLGCPPKAIPPLKFAPFQAFRTRRKGNDGVFQDINLDGKER